MKIDPGNLEPREIYKLMIGIIVPRAIAWVSTIDGEGRLNLAPFSFYTGITYKPPTVCFSVIQRGVEKKDTLRNIEVCPEFTLNTVTEEIGEQMNVTSGDYPHGMDEFAIAGLTPIQSDRVRPPRVAESPITMECRKMQIVYVGEPPAQAGLVIGEILQIHVRDDLLLPGNRIAIADLHAIGRMAGDFYTRTRDLFEMKRPVYKP